ncbi:uncharacterized protein LY89DRAFT_619298 [Mollisia scopiformis]|uniref:Zn(2)-C6 fungal-type domain-containing protein n=1 Tax=Mollisia scopiformis TaxID=149040 RepID=A0A194X5N4_MOLSC|nr:uncharacterized protein LY89DRAFT_619298 [Mollisia scopiformis]KUJ15389.1 hypothetical protein LY89DRAFT_619298 [Mollisia scopiformis]
MGDKSTSTETKPRIRVGHSKAKGGCTTCKARHVKCDETKPACLRCLNFWGRCEGYAAPKKRARPRQALSFIERSRPLLPRSSANPARDTLITTAPFKTADEHQGFQSFVTHTVPQLPGVFSSSLWSKIILQASNSEPFVRDTLSAIGALSSCGRKWAKNLPAGKKSTDGIQVTPQYRFALQQYGNAVNRMRKKLASYANRTDSSQETKDRNLRTALIACLLVICFEGLQGNYFQGLQHASSGHAILHEWLSEHQALEPNPPSSSSIAKPGLGSPQPHLIEDELIHVFSRLDLQIMSFVDARPPSLHSKLKSEGTSTIANMPNSFTSLTSARLYWELIQRRTSHFIGDAATRTSLRQDVDMNIDMGLGSGPVAVTPESEVRLSSHPALMTEYHSYASEISSWFTSFLPFYSTLQTGSRTWNAASTLKIQALSHQILLHSSILADEWSLDHFIPDFRTIVSLGNLISTDPLFSTPHLFSFDTGLVNPIRLVSKWCREPSIRRDSIALLRKVACREGVWDALTMASVSEWMMEVEEERMTWDEEGEWCIRKEDRVRTTNIVIDSLERTATVTCERLGRREDRSKDERETVIKW